LENEEESMKQILISALVAAAVSGIVVQVYETFDDEQDDSAAPAMATAGEADTATAKAAVPSLSYTDALIEDVWINGSRQTGDDHRSLTDADHSICYITKVEISGIRGPDDTSSCVMQIDDFTGFWDLVATVEEGGQSSIRCNARCLTWEEE
jgi:hypothetical protein